MGNSFGKIFKISTFGESHGQAIGALVEGCPAGLAVDLDFVQACLDRRRPGQSALTTQRREADTVEVLSGLLDGKATGMPIMLIIRNTDAKSKDYTHIAQSFRPSHADFTYKTKYGLHDFSGGGRSSARETAARVAAGAIASQWLATQGVRIHAWVSQVGPVKLDIPYQKLDFSNIESTPVRCPDTDTAARMIEVIDQARHSRDTVGGVVSAVLRGVPVGWGEPVFDKLNAALGFAMLGINAVKGFEFGSGFEAATMYGSAHNDLFYTDQNGKIRTQTNFSGGIQGGISNGEDIFFRVAFKPVATIMQPQQSIDAGGQAVIIEGKGRHDPCVLPRAVPIVEAMAALTLADFGLLARTNRL